MTNAARDFLRETLSEVYGTTAEEGGLEPVLSSRYDRVTFVAAELGERLTCDFGLTFTDVANRSAAIREPAVIVESKSRCGTDVANHALRRLGARPLSGCSKYCVGVSLLRDSVRSNDFRSLHGRHFVSSEFAAQEFSDHPLSTREGPS
jgi:hypothetical protein